MMPRHEVDSIDDVGPRTHALAVEHAHAEQAHSLRDAKRSTADDAGHVRTVPVAVDGATLAIERVVETDSAPVAEFPVRRENTGIDHISIHALAVVGIKV